MPAEPAAPSVADLGPFERAAFEEALFEQKLSRLAVDSASTELALQVLTSGVLLNQPLELVAAAACVQVDLLRAPSEQLRLRLRLLRHHLAHSAAPRLLAPSVRQRRARSRPRRSPPRPRRGLPAQSASLRGRARTAPEGVEMGPPQAPAA